MSRKIMFACIIVFLALSVSQVSDSSVMIFEGTYENETVSLTVSNTNIYPTPGEGEPSYYLHFTINPIKNGVRTDQAAITMGNGTGSTEPKRSISLWKIVSENSNSSFFTKSVVLM